MAVMLIYAFGVSRTFVIAIAYVVATYPSILRSMNRRMPCTYNVLTILLSRFSLSIPAAGAERR